jgi:hypothetical protein
LTKIATDEPSARRLLAAGTLVWSQSNSILEHTVQFCTPTPTELSDEPLDVGHFWFVEERSHRREPKAVACPKDVIVDYGSGNKKESGERSEMEREKREMQGE